MNAIELEPVDGVQITVLIDNVTDPLLVDQDAVGRMNWPKAILGGLPTGQARVSPETGVPDALIAEPGFSALVRIENAGRTRTRRQGRAWQFIELFYGNHGEERSGHVTDAFLDRLAKAAGLDVARFDSDRRTAAVAARVREDGHQALAHGFRGTPSFAVSGPRGTRVLAGGAPDSIQPFDDAIRTVS
jgi:hypothetical protein